MKKANPELLKIVGLDRAQSRETIRAAVVRLLSIPIRRKLELVAKNGRVPYTKPKKNKAEESQTWRSTIKRYRESREEFEKHYHNTGINNLTTIKKTANQPFYHNLLNQNLFKEGRKPF
jgi:hypothetical protein